LQLYKAPHDYRSTSNNNQENELVGLDLATELNISNNNLIHCKSDEKVFEKRDHSTEKKKRAVVNDNQVDLGENNLIIADSLENIAVDVAEEEIERDEVVLQLNIIH